MGNTSEGAKRAYQTQRERYGQEWVDRRNSKGGSVGGKRKGFARDPQAALWAAQKSRDAQAARRQGQQPPLS